MKKTMTNRIRPERVQTSTVKKSVAMIWSQWRLVVRMAEENRTWGYDGIVGALANLGHEVSPHTIANILKRHGIEPAPNSSAS